MTDPATDILREFLDGNRNFVTRAKPRSAATCDGQEWPPQNAPVTIVGCSDAPVSPELAFDRRSGGLFVVSVAGNVVDVQVGGSIDYAVNSLGSRLVIVMGHSGCGVVAAALSSGRRGEAKQRIDSLSMPLRQIVTAVSDLHRGADDASRLARGIEANVRFGVTRIRRSGAFAELVDQGALVVVGAILDWPTGCVRVLDGLPER